MTTLPQTTPLRLPRPASSTSLAIPAPVAHGGIVAYSQNTPGNGMTGADVWRVIRSNLWLIIVMLIISSGAGYGANTWLKKYHPRYTANGVVDVIADRYDTSDGERASMDTQDLMLEVKKHDRLLHDPSLFTEVLTNPDSDVRQTAWFGRFNGNVEEAKHDLTDRLDVSMFQDSKLLGISVTDSDPKSCQVLVSSIVNQYIQDQQNKHHDAEYARHREIENEEVTIEGKIGLLNSQISDLEAELNSDGVTGTMNRINAKDMELEKLLESVATMRPQAETDEQHYDTLVQMINNDQDPPEVSKLIYSDEQVDNYRRLDSQLELNLADSQGRYGSENPTVTSIQDHKKLIEQKLASATADARSRYRTAVLEELREKVSVEKREIDSMNKRIDGLKGDMAQLTDKMTQLNQYELEKAGREQKLKSVRDQLDQLNNYAAQHDVAGVEWAARPELPTVASFPKISATMTIAIAMGLVFALGIAFLRELMDTSIRSPRDISRVGNLNLLGMVPHEDDDPQSAGARLPVVIFEAPHSMMAEQLRQVRTRLQHSSSLDTTRSILITSPSPADGKSTIACNLASGLALNGRRILLVDANFRRPELHRVFNLANEQGFSDVLNSLDLFEHAVQETQVPNLYILPSGPKPTNATELIESQLLMDFIERALEEFDHVIFDSGPLLFVSETVALAPRVDGVVTVVRARTNTRGVLSRMKETLRQVKAEHLGVVLNAVRAQGGGYYGRNIRTYYEYQNGGGGRAA